MQRGQMMALEQPSHDARLHPRSAQKEPSNIHCLTPAQNAGRPHTVAGSKSVYSVRASAWLERYLRDILMTSRLLRKFPRRLTGEKPDAAASLQRRWSRSIRPHDRSRYLPKYMLLPSLDDLRSPRIESATGALYRKLSRCRVRSRNDTLQDFLKLVMSPEAH